MQLTWLAPLVQRLRFLLIALTLGALLAGCGAKPKPEEYVGAWSMYLPIPDDVKSRELANTYGIEGLNLVLVFEAGGSFDFYIAKPTAKTEPVAKIGRGQWWIEGRGDAQKLGLRSTEKTIGEQTSLIVTKEYKSGKSGPIEKFSFWHA